MKILRGIVYEVIVCLFFCVAAQTQGTDDFYGMHCGNDTDVPKSLPVLKDLGVKWVRLWADIDWATQKEHGAFQKAREYHAAGYSVILLVSQQAVPTYQQVYDYLTWAVLQPGMKDAVDIWEILNELNVNNNFIDTSSGKYWKGGASSYVTDVLKPAWDVLHPLGEKVLGASFTAWQWNGSAWATGTWQVQPVVDAGYLDYCDFAGIHPYTKSVSEQIGIVDSCLSKYGSKPVLISEYNFKALPDWNEWARSLNEVRLQLQSKVARICYYRLLESSGEGGWPGIVKRDYTPQQPFYDMYKNWPKAGS